jgi:hypothetical protein
MSPHSDVMTFDAMADDLMKLIEDKNLGRITLLGHSMVGCYRKLTLFLGDILHLQIHYNVCRSVH